MTPWTVHGGQLAQARARFGDAAGPWIDLSTGVNPHGWPGADAIAVDWRALPETQSLHALEAAAATHFNVDPRHVAALPGTEIGLRLLGSLLPGPARYRWPAYRTHAEAFPRARAMAIDDFAQLSDGVALLANPNNPDGCIVDHAILLALLERLGRGRGWLVIDEAFADADPAIGLASHIADDRRLLILRSFGKFFGLAGVRLGFLIGPTALVDRIRALLGAWPVSAAGIAIGTRAYRDTGWITAMRARLQQEATALDHMLLRHGLTTVGSCPLFRLFETDDAGALFDRLACRGILTRPFDYAPRWLRLGLPGDAHALARLDEALADG